MNEYGPSLTEARLYKKTSRNGSTYFVGRRGMLKLALLKSNETAEDGGEIWNLVVSQAEEKPRQQSAKPNREDRAKANEPLPSRTSSRSMPNDAIPF